MPIERRTRAPAPSDCSVARKARAMARGTVMFAGLVGAKEVGGMKGRPKKVVLGLLEEARRESRSVVMILAAVRKSVN